MYKLIFELKIVLRQVLKSPGFTAPAVLMLAFGIGATTAVFSLVYGILLRPLPFPDPDRLVTLGDQLTGTNWGKNDPGPVTGPEVVSYIRSTHSFESLGAYLITSYELVGPGQPAHVRGTRMTSGAFSALQVNPRMGRVFTAQEEEQKTAVAVISYAAWKNRFGGNPQILGSKILLDRKPFVIIGVMPREFEFPLVSGRLGYSELWVPMSFAPDEISPEAQASWHFHMIGRLKPGISVAQAESEAEMVAQEIMRNFPKNFSTFQIHAVVYPLQEITVQRTRFLLRTLFLAVSVVLLIACANLAGLLLARAIRRQREMAIRLVMGASATAILRATILESLFLSAGGATLGIGMAAAVLRAGKNLLPETLPRVSEIILDWKVVGFALCLALLTGLLCGLVPAISALRTNSNIWLKEGGRSGSGSIHTRLRSALVVAEISVALILLAASGLLLRSFNKMNAVDLGFRPDHTTTAAYFLPEKEYATQAQVDAFNNELLFRLRQLPKTTAVALANAVPASGNDGIEAFVPEGYENPKGFSSASPIEITGDYFQALGIPLIRGRFFTESDDGNHELVVIVNHELAQHYWPNQDPTGKRMRIGTKEMQSPWMRVVGEVADAKLSSPDADAREQFYQPVAQLLRDAGSRATSKDIVGNGGYVVFRSALPAEQTENALRATVHAIDPQLPLARVATMQQVVAASEAPRRFTTSVISAFALTAVLLAALGIYSLIAFSVASRVQEIAIRMALGSQRPGIVRLVVASTGRLAVAGCGLGLVGAVISSGLLKSLLFNVSPFDPWVMAAAVVAVFLLAFAAAALPARRAASVDPIQALRAE